MLGFTDALKREGYQQSAEDRVWVRPGYSSISYSDGDATEERLSEVIRLAKDRSVLSAELRLAAYDWPSTYHLSPTRANILRPFEGGLDGKQVLEIGSGCGAITRFLGESGARVLALEGSRRRASITRVRTSDLVNVEVMSETFNHFNTNLRFDVITLIGVLEYAPVFVESHDPVATMLEKVRSLLKPSGQLIVAIENQLGLKYLAGAPEDHLGLVRYGVEDRYIERDPRTFGRMALSQRLNDSGFDRQTFLYPFPDYKFPAVILSETGLDAEGFDSSMLAAQVVKRDPQLRPPMGLTMERVWPVLGANGLLADLSNSFLIVAGAQRDPHASHDLDPDLLAVHYSCDRRPEFCKETVFLQSEAGVKVRSRLLSKNSASTGFISHQVDGLSPYWHGTALSSRMVDRLTRDGWCFEAIASDFREFVHAVEVLTGIPLIEGGALLVKTQVPGRYLDLVPQNIIQNREGQFHAIDQEWTLNQPLDLDYLIFRGITTLLGGVTSLGQCAEVSSLNNAEFCKGIFSALGFDLTQNRLKSFMAQEALLQEAVTGRNCAAWAESWPQLELPMQGLSSSYAVERQALNARIRDLEYRVEVFAQSRSWRLTAPLRWPGKILRRLRRSLTG